MPPAIASTLALTHAAAGVVCLRAPIGADPAIGLETRRLAGSAFFLGLGRTTVTTPFGTRARPILSEQARRRGAKQ
jgi:hypothetical protein